MKGISINVEDFKKFFGHVSSRCAATSPMVLIGCVVVGTLALGALVHVMSGTLSTGSMLSLTRSLVALCGIGALVGAAMQYRKETVTRTITLNETATRTITFNDAFVANLKTGMQVEICKCASEMTLAVYADETSLEEESSGSADPFTKALGRWDKSKFKNDADIMQLYDDAEEYGRHLSGVYGVITGVESDSDSPNLGCVSIKMNDPMTVAKGYEDRQPKPKVEDSGSVEVESGSEDPFDF